ncbi:Ig-like domain-containing protein [Rufibacter roseolus]|uniref:Ig-like domain-containing protein n=1 Tax=Rufibacter roseolus TaxID=2817375 RepID=UPI001B30D6CF|nr:Ig-like domain-containing protein [Rufibacter roseolus]
MNNINDKKNPNFHEVKRAFDTYWKGNVPAGGVVPKGKGYKQFKRWEWFWEPRVGASGVFPSPSVVAEEWEKYKAAHPEASQPSLKGKQSKGQGESDGLSLSVSQSSATGGWVALGPSSSPGGYNGVGRINCIAFHPTDPNIFWVGSASGGIWKTTTAGTSWTPLTDNLPVLGVSAIAVNPSNPSIMYIATGDRDHIATFSVGVLKSTDGGATWVTTGLSYTISQQMRVKGLIIHPTNPLVLVAATTNGLYRTANGGTSWALEQSGDFQEIVFKPGDPSTIYASSNGDAQIYRSIDTGDTWTQVTAFSGMNRIALAVTKANSSIVGALCSNSINSGFNGYYTSTNSGASFSLTYGTGGLNLLGYAKNGSDAGGQGWYDLCLAISPTNASVVYTGGVNTWKSTTGGSSWTINSMWSLNDGPGVPIVHADKHWQAFHPLNPGTLYECNDGGLYKTSDGGVTWTDLSNGLGITQFYRMGNSATNPNLTIAGAQDNGTKIRNSSTYTDNIGGDGMEAIIDYSNPSIMYGCLQNGTIMKSTDGGASFTSISAGLPQGRDFSAWVTPYVIDPVNPQTLYSGSGNDVYKTIDGGANWAKISSSLSPNRFLTTLAVAPSNTQTIYAGSDYFLYKTTTGGGSWGSLNLPSSETLTSIEIHPSNPQIVWITFSGYTSGAKVFRTDNGGATWVNISGTLPNLPANTIEYDKNTGVLYLGNDVGVFVRHPGMQDWQVFDSGLPNVVVNELEIHYSTSRLRAATYGRGLWESDLLVNDAPPTVSLTSPANGAVFSAPATITITANAADAGGSISKVEFFSGGTRLGEDLTAPYSYSWAGVPLGDYALTAKATDNIGLSNTSLPVSIKVADYCVPVYTDGCVSFATLVNNFSFHTLVNNNSGCGSGTAPGYINYPPSGTLTTTVLRGQSYPLSMQGTDYPEYFGVWIDYNRDRDFDDPGEFVYASPTTGTNQFTASIPIPATAALGTTRMRVRSNWDPVITGNQSCSPMTWGEAEDYTITLSDGNTPPTVSLTSPASGAVFTAPATVSLAATAADAGGSVAKVEFYQGATKLGEDLTSPYSFSWTGVAAGSYSITARAIDNLGSMTTSAPRSITVQALSTWNRRFGGSASDDFTAAVKTSDGGYLLGGFSSSGISGDRTQASQGLTDFWIVKTGSTGAKAWDKRFGGSAEDNLYSIVQTSDGGYLLGGQSRSGIGGDRTQGSQGGYDYWIVKVSSTGVKQWDRRFGGSADDYLNTVLLTSDGAYLLAGTSSSGISGDRTQASQGGQDFWVVKVSGTGTKLWDKRFGGSASDYLEKAVTTSDGGFLLGGRSSSGISGDRTQASQGLTDYWVVKIGGTGTKLWDKRFGGSADDNLFGLARASDGSFLLAGNSKSGAGGDKTEAGRGLNDLWVVKVSSTGTKLWDRRFGGTAEEFLNDVVATSDGGYLLAGTSSSGISGDKTQASQGGYDYWAVKLSSTGAKQWDKRFGGSGTDQTKAALQTSDGGYLLGGRSASGISGDRTEGSRGGNDFWVVKVGSSGTLAPIAPSVLADTGILAEAQANGDTFLKADPNPFTEMVTLHFLLADRGWISLKVYNEQGLVVARVYEGEEESGPRSYAWKAEGQKPGVYLVRLITGAGKAFYRKVVLIR